VTVEELLQQLKAGSVHVTIRPKTAPAGREFSAARQAKLAQDHEQAKRPTFVADWKQGWKQGEMGVTREQALRFIGWGAVDNAGLMVGPTVRRKPPFP
jgi:hypothetical protein